VVDCWQSQKTPSLGTVTDLTKYCKLIQNLQKLFTVDLYRNINLSSLFLTHRQLQVNSKVILAIFYYINASSFKKFYTEAVKGEVTTMQ